MILEAGDKHAKRAMIMIHGRGATAQGLLELIPAFSFDNMRYIAPQAESGVWYPQSFMKGAQANEPYLSESLAMIAALCKQLMDEGIDQIALLGFSQGACLVLEYAARNPQKYLGIVALSGGLIGKDDFDYAGNLQKTKVFIGCSHNDPFIPFERVTLSATILDKMGAVVDTHTYPGSTHTVTEEEINRINTMFSRDV